MRFPHHTRMSVTRRGDKELRLGAFIARGLDGTVTQARHTVLEPAQRSILVIARSGQSPVVRSIAALARDMAATGSSARVILVKPDLGGIPPGLAAARDAGLDFEVRGARNPRLIEMHEQLVIGARICWTGDTMRRDPDTCDAYESFVEDCPEIAAASASTFARLWAEATQLGEGVATATSGLGTPKAITAPGLMARRP
jgi:hypothetical protein